MSAQTWTDDELQKHLKEWDISRPAGITLTTYPRKNPWVTETFALDCAGSIIALTRPQALIVSDWFRRRAEAFMSSKKEQANERDTHFTGFAKLLYDELENLRYRRPFTPDEYVREVQTIIARCAYDLLYFLMDNAPLHSGSFDVGYGSPGEIREAIEHLPDMTAWPESE